MFDENFEGEEEQREYQLSLDETLRNMKAGDKREREMVCPLTVPEIAERGIEMGRLTREIKKLEAKLKDLSEGLKAEIKVASTKLGSISNTLEVRGELRPVVLEAVPDFEKKLVRLVNTETGETLRTRNLRPEESQMPLAPAKKPEETKADSTVTIPTLSPELRPYFNAGAVIGAEERDSTETKARVPFTAELVPDGLVVRIEGQKRGKKLEKLTKEQQTAFIAGYISERCVVEEPAKAEETSAAEPTSEEVKSALSPEMQVFFDAGVRDGRAQLEDSNGEKKPWAEWMLGDYAVIIDEPRTLAKDLKSDALSAYIDGFRSVACIVYPVERYAELGKAHGESDLADDNDVRVEWTPDLLNAHWIQEIDQWTEDLTPAELTAFTEAYKAARCLPEEPVAEEPPATKEQLKQMKEHGRVDGRGARALAGKRIVLNADAAEELRRVELPALEQELGRKFSRQEQDAYIAAYRAELEPEAGEQPTTETKPKKRNGATGKQSPEARA